MQGILALVSTLAAVVDPEFARFFASGLLQSAPVKLVEAVWGGITDDGGELAGNGGHLAFWFGWFGFYPDTLVYGA